MATKPKSIPSPAALKAFLKAKGLSRAKFGREVSVSHASISRLIDGLQTPSLQTAIAIERATNGAVPANGWPVPEPAPKSEEAA